MTKNICGCCDDNIETKKILLKKINAERIHDDDRIIYIGIVFHICFENYDKSNIKNDIDYTIAMLNKDYNKQCDNFDSGSGIYTDPILKQTYDQYVSLAAICNIQFYKFDIKYSPIPIQTSKDITVLDLNIKGKSQSIESDRYLNLWIVDLRNGTLGYSQFPWEKNKDTDGIVISKDTFGSKPLQPKYNLNKTMTHEIGHWLGLYHIFQKTFSYEGGNINYKDGSIEEEIQEFKGDCISDTPPQALPTYGNPFMKPDSWPSSKANDEQNEYKHMFMNFMDYCDDIALFMFTHDQKIKMRQMIYLYRPNILINNPLSNYKDIIQSEPSTNPKKEFSLCCSKKNIKLLGNKLFRFNAKIVNSKCCRGKKCLRTKKNGCGEFVLNLSVKNALLSVYVRANNPYTHIWVKPVKCDFWYVADIAQNEHFKHYTITLPEPFGMNANDKYFVRFGTESYSSKCSYFEEIGIIYS